MSKAGSQVKLWLKGTFDPFPLNPAMADYFFGMSPKLYTVYSTF